MKTLIKQFMGLTPWRIIRRARANRFVAIDDALNSLKARGLSPPRVIDAGANVGSFAKDILQIFPKTQVHMIEPQPGCLPALAALRAKSVDQLIIYPFALGSPEQAGQTLQLAADEQSTSTGAHVVPSAPDTGKLLTVSCVTLDHLMSTYMQPNEGSLLKLDLQGYELLALKGATKTIACCDVILCEVSFYAQAYEPPISELIGFLDQHGFELYDIAGLYARSRDDRPKQADFVFIRRNCPLAADRAWS